MKKIVLIVLALISINVFASTTYYSDNTWSRTDDNGNIYNSDNTWSRTDGNSNTYYSDGSWSRTRE